MFFISNIKKVLQEVKAFLNVFVFNRIPHPKEVIVRAKMYPQSSSPSSIFYDGKEYRADVSCMSYLPFISALAILAIVMLCSVVSGIYTSRKSEAAIKKLENKVKGYEMRYSRVKQDYITLKNSLALEKESKNALLSCNRKLETNISNIRRNFDTCKQELHNHKCKTELEFNENKIKVQELEVANRILQEENSELKNHLSEKHQAIQHLEQVLGEKNQKEEKLHQILAETNAHLEANQKQSSDMKCLIDKLETSLQAKDMECTTQHHLLNERAKQIEDMTVQEQVLKDTLKNTVADCDQKDRLLRELAIKHEHLIQNFNELECHLGERTGELLQANKERKDLTDQVRLLKDEVQRHLLEIDQLNREIDRQLDENSCLKTKILKIENEKRETELYNEKLRKQLDVLVFRRDNILAEVLGTDDDLAKIQ